MRLVLTLSRLVDILLIIGSIGVIIYILSMGEVPPEPENMSNLHYLISVCVYYVILMINAHISLWAKTVILRQENGD